MKFFETARQRDSETALVSSPRYQVAPLNAMECGDASFLACQSGLRLQKCSEPLINAPADKIYGVQSVNRSRNCHWISVHEMFPLEISTIGDYRGT